MYRHYLKVSMDKPKLLRLNYRTVQTILIQHWVTKLKLQTGEVLSTQLSD